MKKQNIQHVILKTSYELFKQSGYHNVSVLQICQACQISKPTFYKYIGSKENILYYYFQSIDHYIPDKWYCYKNETNYWSRITEGFLFLIDHIQRIGLDLYTELLISSLNIKKQSLIDIRSFKDTMCDLIQEGQKNKQILNMAKSEVLYEIGIRLLAGYGAYWCMNAGKNDLTADFLHGLEACYQIQKDYRHDN